MYKISKLVIEVFLIYIVSFGWFEYTTVSGKRTVKKRIHNFLLETSPMSVNSQEKSSQSFQ